MLLPLLLAVWLCAATDTALTRLATPWRAATLDLSIESLAAWAALALLVAWPAAWTAKRIGTRLGAALLWTAVPVALHAVLRVPLRMPGGLSESSTWIAVGSVLLAALAVVLLARTLERRKPARLLGLALALVGAVALLPLGGAPSPEPQTVPTSGAERPNLLLLVWDTTRVDHTSLGTGDRDTTPHLSALAARGRVFDQAYASTVFTLSSHASMLTGLPPALHGTTKRAQSIKATTLAEHLRAAGYRTGAFVGTSVLTGGNGLEAGFDVYDDLVDPPLCATHLWAAIHDVQAALAAAHPTFRGNGLPHWFQDFQRPASDVLARAAAFANDERFSEDPRPWFLFVNLFDVHWPYLPSDEATGRWVTEYDGPLDGYLFRADDLPADYVTDADDRSHVGNLYDAEMWQLDRDVDAFLSALDVGSGETAVVMTSDHGEGFGEADTWSHEHLHGPQTHVPLVVFAPGFVEPGREASPVSGMDVAPTLLRLASVDLPGDVPMAGVDLTEPIDPERILFVQDPDKIDRSQNSAAAIRGRFKLLSRDGRRTLHDLLDDPMDRTDLAPQHPQVFAELADALETLLAASEAADEGFDNIDTLRALGYLDVVDEARASTDEDTGRDG